KAAEPKTEKQMAIPANEAKEPTPSYSLSPPAGSVAYRVQFVSVREEGAANKARDQMLKENADLFNAQNMHVVRVNLGAKGVYYRVQAGDFAKKEEANTLCETYKGLG